MTDATVETVDRGPKAVSRTVTVPIAAATIFARLSDPRRHHEIDGSGSVGTGISGRDSLRKGDTFSVRMKMFGLPYRITSTVVRSTANRDIEWRHPMGHTWRWQLEPLDDGGTRVTETWDYSGARAGFLLRLMGFPKRNAAGIEATLRGLTGRIDGQSTDAAR